MVQGGVTNGLTFCDDASEPKKPADLILVKKIHGSGLIINNNSETDLIRNAELRTKEIEPGQKKLGSCRRLSSMTNTYPEETEDGRDSLMVMDPEHLKIFVDYMESHPVGLVCSPPHSGKTTLGMQLHKHYLTNNYNTVYISLATLESNPHAHSYEGFNEFWMSKTDSSWTSISSSIVPTRIIVDEAQVIYDNAGFFWGTLKELSST
nr:1991_t:CDS:2 [Entrophospora candida]